MHQATSTLIKLISITVGTNFSPSWTTDCRVADPVDSHFAFTVYQFDGENEQPYAYPHNLFRPRLVKAYSRGFSGVHRIAFWRNAVYDYQAVSRPVREYPVDLSIRFVALSIPSPEIIRGQSTCGGSR